MSSRPTPTRPTRRTPRRLPAAVAALAALALVAAACGNDEESGDAGNGGGALRSVTLLLDWTPNTNHAGFYLARERGWYEEAGLDVRIVEPGADGGLPQLAAGNADFVVSVAEQLLPARAEGVDAVSVAAILAHNTSSLVAPADRGVTRPLDLEGLTYGGFGGLLERALVDELVRCDGGDPEAVEHVEVGNVDYRIGLDRGDYDFVWVFDGWDVIRLQQLEGMELVRLPFYATSGPTAGCLPDWYTPVLATSERLVDTDAELVRAFVGATARGFEEARTNPQAAADALLAGAPELDAELVRLSADYLAERYADPEQPWGRQDGAVWADFAGFLGEAGLLTGDVDTGAAFTNEFLPA